MQTDLFTSKKDQLKMWMRDKKVFATHEVIKWGIENFYNRAAQTKGDLCSAKIIRKLEPEEMLFYGYKGKKEEVYLWTGGQTVGTTNTPQQTQPGAIPQGKQGIVVADAREE